MGYRYTITGENVSISLVQDIVTVKAGSANPLSVLGYWLQCVDSTLPSSQLIGVRARILPATVSLGSGGSTPTPQKLLNQRDPSSNATAHINDTSKSTTGGTAVILDEDGGHIYNGFSLSSKLRRPIDVAVSAAFVFELVVAPSSAARFNFGLDYEEYG